MVDNEISNADLLYRALGKEAMAQQLLFNEVASRARSDTDFQKRLALEPEKAVREVFAELPSEQRSQVGEETIKQTAETVQALTTSTTFPDINKEKVEGLIFSTIEDMRRSFTLSLLLTKILFGAGLVMIGVTFGTALFVDSGQLPALIFGGGTGVLGVVTSLLINPIDRVQNAAGNLVQIEIAFLGYYKQLSQLSLPMNPATDSTLKYVTEVRLATKESIELIEAYCEYRNGRETASTDEQ